MTDPYEAVLSRLAGSGTLERARGCVRAGSVLGVQWSPAGDRVFGQVQGTVAQPYSAIAIIEVDLAGVLRSFSGRCTCPVGVNCKHAVALVLSRPNRSSAHRPGIPEWERRLSAVPPRRDQVAPAAETPIALQFEVFDPMGVDRAGHVFLRPVLAGRNGGWVRAGVSWSSLELLAHRRPGRGSVPPQHLRLLTEIHALDGVGQSRRFAPTHQAIELGTFPSRRVWDLLAEAVEVGLPLVASGRGTSAVVLHETPADLCLDLDRDADGLACRPSLAVSGQIRDAQLYLPVGRPAHGLAWAEPSGRQPRRDLHLARLSGELDDALLGLITDEPLRVPAADEERFFTSFYPRLHRHIGVVSRSGTVDPPEPERPVLVATVEHEGARQLTLRWRWCYRLGTLTRDEPLWPDDRHDDRDLAAETALLAVVGELMQPVAAAWQRSNKGLRLAPTTTLHDMAAVEFASTTLPKLEQLPDLTVETLGAAVDYREIDGPTEIALADASTDGAGDWFDLAVAVSVGGHELVYEQLFVALATGQSHLILSDGRYVDLDRPELHSLAKVIAEARELHDSPPRTMRVSRYQAGTWDDLDALGTLSGPAARWQQTVRALTDVTRLDHVDQPATLHARLRPYQQDGLNWLGFLHANGLGGVLADDMGLGKTVQTLALLCHAKQNEPAGAPVLIVAPTSVMSNWVTECGRFAPSLRVVSITETATRRGTDLVQAIGRADVVVTSYTLFRLEFDAYAALDWSGLVLDEAQAAKNHLSRNYACAKELPAPFKLAITGTPMENHLGELWSLLSITAPGLFPSLARFDEHYRRPIERSGNSERLAQLRRRIRPVMLRRTKGEVALDLPEKQEQILEIELNPRHRRAYDTLLHRERQKVLKLLDDLDGNRFEILRSLTRLRQASLDMALVDPASKAPATKIDVLMELVERIAADGHRTLVFSQFTGFLASVRARLDAAGVEYCYLDGSTRDRAAVLDAFKTGTAPVFLISLKAGGVGLNLTEADYCILLDPWWNPATEAQAVDRTHRIGQTRNVMVYRMVATHTVEEKVAALKNRKAALFDDVLGDGSLSGGRLTVDDIRAMLA